jgi:hypothetical protein
VFPELPTDLSAVEDEQLATLRDELLAQIKHVASNRRDPEVVGELTQAQVTEALEAAVTAKLMLDAEIDSRAAAEGQYDSEVEELAAKAGVTLAAEEKADEADGEEADGDDGEADGEKPAEEAAAEKPEALAAAAARVRPLPAARKHRPTPAEYETKGLRLTSHAAGLGAGFEVGTLLDRKRLAEVMTDMVKKRVKPGERAIVASATYEYPEDRILDAKNGDLNAEKIQAVAPQALVASGANCAPLTPIYELPGVETAVRPVRDSIPSFQATRGGVIIGATPRMTDYAAAVGVVAAADNAQGGTFATKTCMRIECPDFTSIQVDSIYTCIEADNLAARAYPELMARIDELVRAEQARAADSRLLDFISAGSKQMDGENALTAGAIWSLFGDVYHAAAQIRSANRMPEGATLTALFPAWIIDLLALDIARGQFDRFQTRQQIVSILEGAGVNVTFYLDGSSTAAAGQVYSHAVDGNLAAFPASAEWFIFPPGSWLHLDSGTLELGVVRDSTLNSTNDFQIFAETWEQVAFVGVESLAVTSRVCPSGEVAAPANVAGHCGT